MSICQDNKGQPLPADAGGISDQTPGARANRYPLLVASFYFVLECIVIFTQNICRDEAQGAYAAFRLLVDIPYLDFQPYKNVLGYYIQLPLLTILDSYWGSFLFSKICIALLITLTLFWLCRKLSKIYSPQAAAMAMLLLILMTNFFEHSAELRVDPLLAVFGTISLVLMLERKPGWSGFWVSVAFLANQRAALFVVAGFIALITAAVRLRTRESLLEIVKYGCCAAFPLMIYIAFWSLFAGVESVVGTVFLSSGNVVKATGYTPQDMSGFDIHSEFWLQTLRRNPIFFCFGLMQLFYLGFSLIGRKVWGDRLVYPRTVIFPYFVVFFAAFFWQKLPWPYVFVSFALPWSVLLSSAFFDLFLPKSRSNPLFQGCIALAFLLAVLLSLDRFSHILDRDAAYQRHMFEIAQKVLESDDQYIGGSEMFFRHQQSVPKLRWLDHNPINRLHAMSVAELTNIVDQIRGGKAKLLVFTWRFTLIPRLINEALFREFAPLWGSLYVYGPDLTDRQTIQIKFQGSYRVDAPSGLVLEDRNYEDGSLIILKALEYHVVCQDICRLVFQPKELPELKMEYRENRNEFMRAHYLEYP